MGLTLSDLAVPDDLAGNPWLGALSKRAKEVLVFSLKVEAASKASSEDASEKAKILTAVDVSQRIDRAPRGWCGIMPTLTPRSQIWQVKKARPLAGIEHLALQGFPLSMLMLSSVSSSQLRDLAGNAFAANVFMPAYIALAAHMPQIDPHPEVHDLLALAKLQELMSRP